MTVYSAKKIANPILLLYGICASILVLILNESAIYLYVVNFLIGVLFTAQGRWLDSRVGLLLFSSLYYLGTYTTFFWIGVTDIASFAERVQKNLTSYDINIQALVFVVVFQLGIIVSCSIQRLALALIPRTDSKINAIVSDADVKLVRYGVPLALAIYASTLLGLDWQRISREYTLDNISNSFFSTYLIFTFLAFELIIVRKQKKRIPYRAIFITFTLVLIFNYLGVRQVLVWGSGIAVIAFATFIHVIKNSNLNLIRNMKKTMIFGLVAFAFFTAVSVSFLFRHKKNEIWNVLGQVGVEDLTSLVKRGFVAESSLTSYNLLAVVEENNRGNSLFPLQNLLDPAIMMVPRAIWPQKYDYIATVKFDRRHNVKPFGTWYIAGLFASSLLYPCFVFLGSLLYASFLRAASMHILRRSSSLAMAATLLALNYIFLGLYIVRGSWEGGVKLFFTLLAVILIVRRFGNTRVSSSLPHQTPPRG